MDVSSEVTVNCDRELAAIWLVTRSDDGYVHSVHERELVRQQQRLRE